MSDDALRQAFGHADRKPFRLANERPGYLRARTGAGSSRLSPAGFEGSRLWGVRRRYPVSQGEPEGALGIELFEEKVAFARAVLPKCRFVVGSVYDLPVEAHSFDQVIVRDVVHHLEEPQQFVDECARVLQPVARIDVLEPCRYNPLICLHALTNKAERDETAVRLQHS